MQCVVSANHVSVLFGLGAEILLKSEYFLFGSYTFLLVWVPLIDSVGLMMMMMMMMMA